MCLAKSTNTHHKKLFYLATKVFGLHAIKAEKANALENFVIFSTRYVIASVKVNDHANVRFQYAQLLYGDQLAAEAGSDDEGDGEINIEAEIQQELADIRKPQAKPLFWSIKLDVQCGKRTHAASCYSPDFCSSDLLQDQSTCRASLVRAKNL